MMLFFTDTLKAWTANGYRQYALSIQQSGAIHEFITLVTLDFAVTISVSDFCAIHLYMSSDTLGIDVLSRLLNHYHSN